MVVRVWDGGQDDIQAIIAEYPSTKKFYKMIAKELECEITDIVCLTTDSNGEDAEGWNIETFFPNQKIETETLFDEYQVKGFSFGVVKRVIVNGIKFIAEQNASPFNLYANFKKIESYVEE